MPIQNISIIGAGLSGLTLALFLRQQQANMHITIYETRAAETTSPGALLLSPNALRSLDAVGLYGTIQPSCFRFRKLSFLSNSTTDEQPRVLSDYEMGNASRYGYDAVRVYRQTLLDAAKAAVRAVGGGVVEVVYGKKFSRVISAAGEGQGGVTFEFADGEVRTADLLVGADGIHSSVRKFLAPGVEPRFSGIVAVTGKVATDRIEFPFEPFPLPAGIHGSAGAFVMAPQGAHGEECLIGTQYRMTERDRSGWEALAKDKTGLVNLLREREAEWNGMVQSAMRAVESESMAMWPFYTVPRMERWSSKGGEVVMLGDAAHAISPAAGQGVNQAFEDVHSFALLVGAVNEGRVGFTEGLKWWQEYRQARVDRVGELTDQMNERREPGWDGEGAEPIDCAWLYGVDIEGDFRAWLATKEGQSRGENV